MMTGHTFCLLHYSRGAQLFLIILVRVWNTGSGKELFRMDGFPDPIRSLCLFDGGGVNELSSTAEPRNNLLITDGMNKYVCVNDFSTSVDDEDFDLEMPEYLKG